MSFLQNSLFNELFQFSFTHSQIYTSSHKQKTTRLNDAFIMGCAVKAVEFEFLLLSRRIKTVEHSLV